MAGRMKAGDLVGGKYRLVRRLGQGAMGVVWEATHEVTSRRVAMKLIVNATDNLRKRLLREAQAAGRIAHRNVVEVYDIGETSEGDPFLVMQLLTGDTLYGCLKREGALDRARGLAIVRDICRALVAAHAQGIVHRDLKPANVFLHSEAGGHGEIVKVLDFGLCKPMGADEMLTAPGGMLGSPSYMSPEQILGAADLDPRTDIWALGVLLFEIVSGKRPFAGRGPDLIHAVLTDPIPRLREAAPNIDPELDELVARCLSRERESRIASASEMLARLDVLTTREEQRASRQTPEAEGKGDSELEVTQLYRPGQLLTPPIHRVSKTIPMSAVTNGPPSSAAPAPPIDAPPSSPHASRASQPDSMPGSGPWSPPSRPGPDSSPFNMAVGGLHGTVPMPRLTAAQAQQWAAGVSPQPQQPPPQPPPQPSAPSWPMAAGQAPPAFAPAPPAPMYTAPTPAAPPQRKLGLFIGLGVAFVVVVVLGLYLGLSGQTNAPEKPAGATSAKSAPAKAPR